MSEKIVKLYFKEKYHGGLNNKIKVKYKYIVNCNP